MGRGPTITEERKRAIREMASRNPDMTHEEIAMVAGCCSASVSRILAPPPEGEKGLPSPLKRADIDRMHASLEEMNENMKTAVRYLNLMAVMMSDALFTEESKERYESAIKRIAGMKKREAEVDFDHD